ncbi:type II toxin-antitoxin system RelB/DinJ family antitoxin [Erwinia sp. E602]|uniref:type II toxin-antitoxin system RelB/DinJ family antitoxin n=1 Tax=Erwinia sp. E602 TaxID=2675378 RepID=UPI0020130850|nr:type II toxin-antitoxin system RelB/DinJ family antitoxin [Erwinia sp. E602]
MQAIVRARIDNALKSDATQVLSDCGLTLSTAIRLFLEQVVIKEGLPFEVNRTPNATTLAAMAEADEMEARHRQNEADGYSTINEMMDKLNRE